jgi:hypothetical protein
MHTPKQARTLWCPMARVAQVGAAETTTTYNRVFIKTHVPIRLADASPEAFELGQQPEPISASMLKTDLQISGASRCIADQCAMWRWEHTTASVPTTTLGAGGEPARTFETRTVRTHGYCGLAPIHSTTN